MTENISEFEADAKARTLTAQSFVFDGLALNYVLNEPYATRCLEAGVNAANVTFVAEANWNDSIRAFESGLDRIERSPILGLAVSADDARNIAKSGKMAVMIGTQGASMIDDQLWRASFLARLGLRFIGLAYTSSNAFADGCGEPRDAGLTFLGREFIAAVNELPLLLDLSHVGHRSRAEAADLADRPVLTHVDAYPLCANDRNVHDAVVQAVVAKGGVVAGCGLPTMVRAEAPTVTHLAEHIAHFVSLVGAEYVGFGLDLNEAFKAPGQIPAASRRWRTLRPDIFGTVEDFFDGTHPAGIRSISELPNLTQALIDNSFDDIAIRNILGQSWLACLDRMLPQP